MEEQLIGIKNNAVSLILEAESVKELEELKLQFLGRSGVLTQLLKEIPKFPKEQIPIIGKLSNEVKTVIEESIDNAERTLIIKVKENVKVHAGAKLDVTDPGVRPPLGNLHPITQAIEEITSIFSKIGFSRTRYPEIEWDWYAFEALNFPENHPARDDWETFFIDQASDPKKGPVVLTPHTSSGQIRELEKFCHAELVSASKRIPGQARNDINIRMLNIAKTYRRQSDVSHTPMFHQFETLVVGEGISITHLKGVLDHFVKSYFGPDRKSRIRPYHFQFTEPSFETDVSCGICDGQGILRLAQDGKPEVCRFCKEGWLELGGAGMVHPNVFKNCGVDPEKYTGFASGWGVERVLMMKEGLEIDDLRLLYSNKFEFLEQF